MVQGHRGQGFGVSDEMQREIEIRITTFWALCYELGPRFSGDSRLSGFRAAACNSVQGAIKAYPSTSHISTKLQTLPLGLWAL